MKYDNIVIKIFAFILISLVSVSIISGYILLQLMFLSSGVGTLSIAIAAGIFAFSVTNLLTISVLLILAASSVTDTLRIPEGVPPIVSTF